MVFLLFYNNSIKRYLELLNRIALQTPLKMAMKSKIYCSVFFFISLTSGHLLNAQINKKIYFDVNDQVSVSSSAAYYIEVQLDEKERNSVVITSYYKSGTKKFEGIYALKKTFEEIDFENFSNPEFWHEAVKNSNYKEWYRSGKIKEEGWYKNGFRDGQYKEYHENGKLKSDSYFENGKAEGMVSIYHENGKLDIQYMMVNNQLNGELISYQENGKKRASYKFRSNVDTGEVKYWDEEGIEVPAD